MRRLNVGLMWFSVASATPVLAQSALTMNQESHHERLTYIRNMRVFQLTLAPGESTADHLNDYDVATVPIVAGTTRIRRAGQEWTVAQYKRHFFSG
jgi:hypothetical protein